MTDDKVLSFPDLRAEKSYWVCGCGCMSHYILATGEAECASCGNVPCPSCDGFYLHKPNGLVREMDDAPVALFSLTDNIEEISHKRWAERLKAGEFMIMIGLRRDGNVATHAAHDDVETVEQKAWLRRQLRAAYKLLTRPVRGGE